MFDTVTNIIDSVAMGYMCRYLCYLSSLGRDKPETVQRVVRASHLRKEETYNETMIVVLYLWRKLDAGRILRVLP